MKTTKLDKKFDDNQQDILQHFDISNVRLVNEKPKRINIDFPTWMVQSLDKEAKHIGISRQAVIKTWVAERLNSSIR
ncbi:MAG: CopG family transcriptional regulator [Candidatus Thioglobus sp.]|nr:CopG family transcriptional regulator [Candidatus Thioglobus sp.]